MKRFIIVFLGVLIFSPAHAVEKSRAMQAALHFIEISKGPNAAAVSKLIHPEALALVRKDILESISGDDKYRAARRVSRFLSVKGVEDIKQLSDAEIFSRLYVGIRNIEPIINRIMDEAQYTILEEKRNGALTNIKYRLIFDVYGEVTTKDVSLLLKMYDDKWLIMFEKKKKHSLSELAKRFNQ